MTIRCLIIDDEPPAINVIKNYLQRIKNIEIVAALESVMDAYSVLEEEHIDLIFLDIQMPMLTGPDFIRSLENPPEIILTTAFRDHAVEGFELNVLDYLLKPIPFPRFVKSMAKAQKIIRLKQLEKEGTGRSETENRPAPAAQASANPYIFLKVDKKMVKVYLSEILYIESLKDYILVKTETDDLVVHQTLSNITEMLPSHRFQRIHRSYTASVEKIKSVEGNCIEIGTKQLPVGRLFLQEVREIVRKHLPGGA